LSLYSSVISVRDDPGLCFLHVYRTRPLNLFSGSCYQSQGRSDSFGAGPDGSGTSLTGEIWLISIFLLVNSFALQVRVWNTRSGAQEATWPGIQGGAGAGGSHSACGHRGGDGIGSGAVSTVTCDSERAFVGDRRGCVRIFALAPHLRGIS